jgi:hypothetical protein
MHRTGRAVALGIVVACLGLAQARVAEPPPREVAVTGTVTVLQEDDFASGRTRRTHVLEERTGSGRYRLRLPAARHGDLRSGTTVALRGILLGDEIAVGAAPADLRLVELPAAVTGSRSVLVLVADFQGSPVSCSNAQIAGLMFGASASVDGLYRASSYGAISFPGGPADVRRVSIGASAADPCNPNAWASTADAAAAAAGVDLGSYQHRVYVLPSNVSCGWAGLATVGCFGVCRAWVATCQLPDVYAHELGHNLGLGHASTDADDDGDVDSEYGDNSDFMGVGGLGYRHTNAPHKIQPGWMPAAQVVDVAGEGSRTVVVAALDVDPGTTGLPQVVRVVPPQGGDPYIVSYRRRAGFDQTLSSSYAERTSVHRHAGGSANTLLVATLADGEAFTDATGDVTIRQVAHDAGAATLLVGTSCAIDAPVVGISPSSITGLPGELVTAAVDVLNGDAAGCPATSFDLAATLPPGWTALFVPPALTLAPGEAGTALVAIRSPADAPDGSVAIALDAADAAAPGHGAGTVVSFSVEDAPLGAPSDLRAALVRHRFVQLGWTAGAGASRHRVYRDGAPLGEVSGTAFVDWSPVGVASEYHVTAVDAAGRESAASAPVEVVAPSGPPEEKGRASGSDSRSGGHARSR